MIRKLTEREHICARPAMYIGSVDNVKSTEFIFENDKIVNREIDYVPGLIKIINEIIDNCVDVAIKTQFKYGTNISVKLTETEVFVEDDGTGIPVKKNQDGHYLPELCWNHARAGSNFDDDANRTQIGLNGVGSYTTACFSTKFIGTTDDGSNRYTITITDNAERFIEKVSATKEMGTSVRFWPDLEKFGLTQIDEVHQNVIKQRLINLSLSFPEITFKFNGRKINVNSFKKYVSLFNEEYELYETENYKFAVLPNADDDFKQFSYVNGLKIPDGGTHIDVLSVAIVNRIRDKLVKKYKTIKPGDIKNKLMVIAFLKNVKNTKFNSQSKEKITNSIAEINSYFGEIPYDQLVYKIMRNAAIMDPIVEVYKIKEELKRRQDMKELGKTVKKIKSDKYLPSIGTKKYLMLVEGESALGGLSPVFGRKECGYYVLKGVPLNSYSAHHAKFAANKELSELYKIIQNENYEYVVFATDQDLDGFHIRGLLVGFFEKYLPDYKNRVCMLQTPVIIVKKKDKIIKWSYNLNEQFELNSGEISKFHKGIGSWTPDNLRFILSEDKMSNMIQKIEWDDTEIIHNWLSDVKSDKRKEYIMNNNFNIAKI